MASELQWHSSTALALVHQAMNGRIEGMYRKLSLTALLVLLPKDRQTAEATCKCSSSTKQAVAKRASSSNGRCRLPLKPACTYDHRSMVSLLIQAPTTEMDFAFSGCRQTHSISNSYAAAAPSRRRPRGLAAAMGARNSAQTLQAANGTCPGPLCSINHN